MRRLAVFVLAVSLMGCAARPIHPGTAGNFDSNAYDAILVTHNVIESTKTDLANGVFSPTVAPRVKTALNGLITIYNGADTLYCNPSAGGSPTTSCASDSYHAMAVSGNATPAQQQAMQAKLDAMNSAVSTLTAAKANQ